MSISWIRRACLGVTLLLGLYAAGVVMTNILLSVIAPVSSVGDDQQYDIDYDAMPGWLRTCSRVSTYGLLCIGLFSAWNARHDRRLLKPIAAYALLFAWAAFLLLARTTAPMEVLATYSVWGNLAPGTLGVLGLFFLGANPQFWPTLKEYLSELIILFGVAVILLVPFVEPGSRASGRRYLLELAPTLQLCAVMPIVCKPRRVPVLVNYLPLAAVIICGLLTETRQYLLIALVELFAVAIVKRRRIFAALAHPSLSARRLGFQLIGILVLFVLVGTLAGRFSEPYAALRDRMKEDTRSGQAITFFDSVAPQKLILGVGYPTNGEYTSEGITGIDSGYVNALYVGGIPALLLVGYMFALPGLRGLGAPPSRALLEVVPVCVASSLALCSSFVLKLSTGLVIFAICSGRGYALLSKDTLPLKD